MVVGNAPHPRNLRTGRVSMPGGWYALTVCVAGRRPLLVVDPLRPRETGAATARAIEAAAWLERDGAWVCRAHCGMPDHLHLVIELGPSRPLSAVLNAFKSFSAREANRCHGLTGRFWQRGFYDHALRRDEAWEAVARHVVENPVRRGYVDRWQDWPWSGVRP